VPNQHGAWAMVVTPALAGGIVGGFGPRSVLLLVAWLAGYGAYFAFTQWLRTPVVRRARWRAPLVTYGAVAAFVGGTLILMRPELLWWGPAYVALTGVSLAYTASGAARAWINDIVLMVAANLMAVTAVGASRPLAHTGGTPAWWPPGVDDPWAWLAAGMLFAYFLGTVFYVKTNLRERGHLAVYVASVAYHLVLAVAAWFLGVVPGIVGLALLARAAVVPKLPRRASAAQIGFGEFGATVCVLTAVLVTVFAR